MNTDKFMLPMVNSLGGLAPPLTILKRNEGTDWDQLDDLCKQAEDAIECGDLATAEDLIKLMDKAEDDELEKAADFAGSLDRGTGHRNMGPTGIDREHQPTTRRLEVLPATRAARPHEFDAKVAFVMDRDAVSKNEAMATARREYPDVYQDYQQFNASTPTNEQATRRGNYKIGKSTSPITYEDLVSDEMRKGCNMEVASQRVMQQHGSAALRHRFLAIEKNYIPIGAQLTEAAEAIMLEEDCSRTEALRKARLQNPSMYKALRSL